MVDRNAIGDRGETIFNTRITEGNMFKVYFLGEKAPIVDFLLEILDEDKPYYFMVQVKSTEQGLDRKGFLKAKVPQDKLKKLVRRLVPTYVSGVDIKTETVYLCSAFDEEADYSKIPTTHLLNFSQKQITKHNLALLKQDVINFYQYCTLKTYKSNFQSLL